MPSSMPWPARIIGRKQSFLPDSRRCVHLLQRRFDPHLFERQVAGDLVGEEQAEFADELAEGASGGFAAAKEGEFVLHQRMGHDDEVGHAGFLKDRAIADDPEWRREIAAPFLCEAAAGFPGTAFKDLAEAQGRAEAQPDHGSQAVQQSDRRGAPFDDGEVINRKRLSGERRIAQGQHACIQEQAAIPVFREAGQRVQIR